MGVAARAVKSELNRLFRAFLARAGFQQGAQRHLGRGIGDAIDAIRAIVPLECGDDGRHGLVVVAADRLGITEIGQHALELRDVAAKVAGSEPGSFKLQRRGAHPVADTRIGERRPWEFLAGILLTRWRDVGMRQHAIVRDRIAAGENALAQRDHRGDLAQRKRRIAVVVTGIADLDADGMRIDVGVAIPRRDAGVPRALALRHALDDAPVRKHDVVGRHLGVRIAQPRQRRLIVGHAGVVQQDHIRLHAILALIEIGRRNDVGDDERVGLEGGHGLEGVHRQQAEQPAP